MRNTKNIIESDTTLTIHLYENHERKSNSSWTHLSRFRVIFNAEQFAVKITLCLEDIAKLYQSVAQPCK
jgi:hypothetical protein